MGKACVFFITFIVICLTASAQKPRCKRKDCTTREACNMPKCDAVGGTCMRNTEEDALRCAESGGYLKEKGRGKWCKFPKKCKCCVPIPCDPRNCTYEGHTCPCFPKDWIRAPGWHLTDNNECHGECQCYANFTSPSTAATPTPSCDPECVNGDCLADNTCDCWPGWTGPTCETPVCDPPCENGGICIEPDVCDCEGTGYYGICCSWKNCNESQPCTERNAGTCHARKDPIVGNAELCPVYYDTTMCTPECACCIDCQLPKFCTYNNHTECPCLPNDWAFWDYPGYQPIGQQECSDGCQCYYNDTTTTTPTSTTTTLATTTPSWEKICPLCLNGGICVWPGVCDCTPTKDPGYHGPVCQFINCEPRANCIAKSGACYAKNNPILEDPERCPSVDNGKKWCTPMCACCFGA